MPSWLDQLLSLSGLYQQPQQPAGPPPQPTPPHTPTPASAYTQTIPAPPLAQYPTSEDATAARAGGFGYGEPWSAYVEGTAGRIFGDKQGPVRAEGRAGLGPWELLDSDRAAVKVWQTPTTQRVPQPEQARLQDQMTRAALAAQHSPVAAVGFDPRHITTDVTGKSNLGALGLTRMDTGEIMSSSPPPGHRYADYGVQVPVHESIHRGLLRLMDRPGIPDYLRQRIDPYNESGDHEALVYQLMARQAGDPDKPYASAERKFKGAQWTDDEIAILDKVAQQFIKEQRPRGPR
jgi:hypothetical protein